MIYLYGAYMILGHSELLKLIEGKKLIENFELKNVESAGVDIRAGNMYRLKSRAKLGVSERVLPHIEKIEPEDNAYTIKPNEYFLIESVERVNMPSDIAARMLPRSTLQRSGVYLFHAFIDPGYRGTLTFGIKNLSKFNFEFERGAKVAQLIFEKVKGKTKLYDGRYQHGKIV